MLQWIDSHTHLEHEYPFSVDEYLTNGRANGLVGFVTIGTRPESLGTLKNFAEKYSDVWFTVGIHPHEAKDLNAEVEANMRSLHSHPKCVGVGEIGLDYYYNHSPKEVQQAAFRKQMELALEWNKPIVIHARDAEADLVDGLKWFAPQSKWKGGPGIIHCFSGTRWFAEECLKLGFYISFSGILTFKTAEVLREIAKDVPLNRVLVETDSPFLTPVPHRGKPNQSSYLPDTAKVLAKAQGIEIEALSLATVANTKHVFGL